jgi:hypothetical protein
VRNPFLRFTGVILIITAIAGIIFSMLVLAGLWIYRPTAAETVRGNVLLVRDTLQTTSSGLVIMEQSLESAISSFTTLETTVIATANSIEDSTPMLNTLVLLTAEDLPATISSAQLSLEAAQDSAEIIDGLLTFLANLPLVPRNLYNPPVPLHTALGQVSDSLENMPQALTTIEESLTTTSANMITIRGEISLIADDLSEINLSLVEARGVIGDYQVLVTDLQTRADRLEQDMEAGLNILILVLSFILVWIAISQLGLLVQGIDLLSPNRAEK